MGKSLPTKVGLSRIGAAAAAASKLTKTSKPTKSAQSLLRSISEHKSSDWTMEGGSSNSVTETSNSSGSSRRVPLSAVVADCAKRWFKDTLQEAKTGDINMQILVGQMYYSGYGVPRDTRKGKIWMTRASRTRSSVWGVSDKHPGYNASDSDSDEMKGDF